MIDQKSRRELLSLLGGAGVGVVFSTGLSGCHQAPPSTTAATVPGRDPSANDGFFFLQLTDTHFGYKGPANPEGDVTLKKVVALINSSTRQPDFIVFTGDLTHTTDDPQVRRKRLADFKSIVGELKCKTLHFLPGEHDGSLDNSQAYRELFGETKWSFDFKGVHFVGLDNISDLDGGLGEAQLAWLEADLARLPPEMPVVVFAHRPLFPIQQQWDWWTADGEKAIAILMRRKHVSVFYGHIHQEHHYMTGHVAHHSARSLIFELPRPGSTPKRVPTPWRPEAADKRIGFRQVVVDDTPQLQLTDFTSAGARLPQWQPTPLLQPIPTASTVVSVLVKRSEVTPSKVVLRRGTPTTLALVSGDRNYTFSVPDLGIKADLRPGEHTGISFTPNRAGAFAFTCAAGPDGRPESSGTLVVAD